MTDEDVENFRQLIEGEHLGPAWQKMMEKDTGRMTYVAWRRDTEVGHTLFGSQVLAGWFTDFWNRLVQIAMPFQALASFFLLPQVT